ncbi:hypothetical protein B296_00003731 [Ensete ventricosum]|uniref:Secreted protein n=1 Tax=Ensete ventricosum TaxID=4639 RepID=A0A427B7D1_ENSVE|nr:hypothetical protein B296_00003731 [Ensete ventricosum]
MFRRLHVCPLLLSCLPPPFHFAAGIRAETGIDGSSAWICGREGETPTEQPRLRGLLSTARRRGRQWIGIADKYLEKIACFTSQRPPPVAMEAWCWGHPLFGSNRQWKRAWSWHGSKGGFPRDGRNLFYCGYAGSLALFCSFNGVGLREIS